MNMTLGMKIFNEIDSNEYLQELFSKLLLVYSRKLFNIECNDLCLLSDTEIIDVLRFADILSKSTSEMSDAHKNWAQEIVVILYTLYPENKIVKLYMESVLENNSNYRGLAMYNNKYRAVDVLNDIYNQYKREYLQIPGNCDMYFFKPQKYIYDSFEENIFSYSGPTSIGKSFVIRMYIKNNILKNLEYNYVILVPTKALINETSSNIIEDLKELLITKNYRVITNYGAVPLENNHNFILVLTPERLLYLLLNKSDFKLDYVFIDEAHRISKNDSRSTFYYKIISILSLRKQKPHFIFSAPNIPNPEVYLKLTQSNINTKNIMVTSYSPVSQFKYLIDLVDKKIILFNRYIFKDMEIPFIDSNINLNNIIRKLGCNKQNIVYCSSIGKAIEYALSYTNMLKSENNENTSDVLRKFSKEIAEEIHKEYYLSKIILQGVAYHVGYLPNNIKRQIEELFRKGEIKTVFCTSTLIEGVNLPADNLFVTSYKNGKSNMSDVDFNNLVGRVGRIEYNLYGNVFLVRLDRKIETDKYSALIKNGVSKQEVSLISCLNNNQKKHIVDSLEIGNTELSKIPNNQTEESYSIMRKFTLILLNDILNNNESYVYKTFSEYLTNDKLMNIKKAFSKKIVDNDINISLDQIDNLQNKIANGLTYPDLDSKNNVSYKDLTEFLEKLNDVFKWDLYEKSTLGFKNKDNYNHSKLRMYAVILCKWMNGEGLQSINNGAIDYKKRQINSKIKENGKLVPYNDSKRHMNIVISDTLDIIENIILFKISSYFLRFSMEYKKFHGISKMDNDWYEYVEYGTTNKISIFLQKNGFSREASMYIKRNSKYLEKINGEYKINKKIIEKCNTMIRKELTEISFNIPELFF